MVIYDHKKSNERRDPRGVGSSFEMTGHNIILRQLYCAVCRNKFYLIFLFFYVIFFLRKPILFYLLRLPLFIFSPVYKKKGVYISKVYCI